MSENITFTVFISLASIHMNRVEPNAIDTSVYDRRWTFPIQFLQQAVKWVFYK